MWFFTPEQLELKKTCDAFAQLELAPKAEHFDQTETFNLAAFQKMGDLGLLGITADPAYGGAGLGATEATIVMEAFGAACASSTLSYLAHSILCVNNIDKNANEEQKRRYLPKLISGEHIGCMGMSEPENGSDAVGIQCKAQKNPKGHYEITGSKMWITNAQYAQVIYLYTRTGSEKKNLSTFIVDRPSEGLSVSKEIHKMGMRASPTGELSFQRVAAAPEQLVGKEGDSVYHMMKNLDLERLTISGISLGIAQSCLTQCLRYSKERKQFGQPIGEFQLIQKMIAEMSAEVEMMRHFLYSACMQYDRGMKDRVLASQVKLNLPKMATKIALDAIQLHGGYGYSREFPVERYLRDAKLMEIGAGTNEMMILIIAKELLKRA